LIELSQHPEQLIAAGNRAREIFDQEFSAHHCVTQTINVYQETLNR